MEKRQSPEESQGDVTALLRREVVLMREILSSMYEEERALLEKNPKALQSVMFDRNKPLQDLKDVREEISLKTKGSTVNDFENWEVLLLADQIVALAEKMNAQSASVAHLMEETHPYWKELVQGAFTLDVHHPSAFRAIEQKRKGLMLTVENPEETTTE